jgi:hypothetical protein
MPGGGLFRPDTINVEGQDSPLGYTPLDDKLWRQRIRAAIHTFSGGYKRVVVNTGLNSLPPYLHLSPNWRHTTI